MTVQGFFLKRQKEVSEIFARVICVEILHIKAIWTAIFHGTKAKNFTAMLRAHTLVFTDKLVAEIEPLAVAAMGSGKFLQMKEDIAWKVATKLPDIIDSSFEYTQKVRNHTIQSCDGLGRHGNRSTDVLHSLDCIELLLRRYRS
jgi:hypothetical protein